MSFEKIEAICGKAAADELRELKAKVDQLVNGPFAAEPESPKPSKPADAKPAK